MYLYESRELFGLVRPYMENPDCRIYFVDNADDFGGPVCVVVRSGVPVLAAAVEFDDGMAALERLAQWNNRRFGV